MNATEPPVAPFTAGPEAVKSASPTSTGSAEFATRSHWSGAGSLTWIPTGPPSTPVDEVT
jgi:hypothetical protein